MTCRWIVLHGRGGRWTKKSRIVASSTSKNVAIKKAVAFKARHRHLSVGVVRVCR